MHYPKKKIYSILIFASLLILLLLPACAMAQSNPAPPTPAAQENRMYLPIAHKSPVHGSLYTTVYCQDTGRPAVDEWLYFTTTTGHVWQQNLDVYGRGMFIAPVGTWGYLHMYAGPVIEWFFIGNQPTVVQLYIDCDPPINNPNNQ